VTVQAAQGTTAQTITITSTPPSPAIVGGTYNVVATATSGLAVTLSINAASSSVCTINGPAVTFVGVGSCVIVANQGGNATFAAAPQITQTVLVQAAQGTTPQVIAITSTPPSPAAVGGTYGVIATASSGLSVTLSINAASSATCTIAGSTVTFVAAGTCMINADQPGDATFAPAPQAMQMVIVQPAQGTTQQTIAITSVQPMPATAGGATYAVVATASSGLAVTLTIDATSVGVCTIAGSTVTFVGAGTCRVNADQAGDTTFAPAPQVTQVIQVLSATDTIFKNGFE
jgi:hypothetical protein